MNRYKKRTISLILASVVTVVGAFGAGNFKDNLMSLKFEGTSHTTNLTFYTQKTYANRVNPVKVSADTYVLMLPEINDSISTPPKLSDLVDSVEVKTMPYTKNSKGYTKITLKVVPNTSLFVQNAVFIPDKTNPMLTDSSANARSNPVNNSPSTKEREEIIVPYRPAHVDNSSLNPNDLGENKDSQSSNVNDDRTSEKDISRAEEDSASLDREESSEALAQGNKPVDNSVEDVKVGSKGSEVYLLLLGCLLIIVASVYFYVSGKNKIAEIIGEQADFDIDEPRDDTKNKDKDKNKKNVNKKKEIGSVINRLDKKYVSNVSLKYNEDKPKDVVKPVEVVDNENIVDLDEILSSTKQPSSNQEGVDLSIDDSQDEEENLALEEFLSAYVFDNQQEDDEIIEDEHKINEELYNKYINDENLLFTKDDIVKINELLKIEINDETVNNIDKYVVTNPIEKRVSRQELLENIVTTYTINQNIVFTEEDINALDKLMSVELDNDFITDLRTNPNRIKMMQEEIKNNRGVSHKKSEILTLNVKDMLPNLSDALKKQGGKRIESEYKPQVVYYSEGYDVSVLSLKDQLPDLSVEINNEASYVSRPSDEIKYAETGYDVDKLSVSDEFLDLDAMIKHQEELDAKTAAPVEVDEEALLRNITNVTFKPFYSEEEENNYQEDAPSFSEIQAELNGVGDSVEIIKDNDEVMPSSSENDNDDFESLFSNEYFDLDKSRDDVGDESFDDKNRDAKALLDLIQKKQDEKQNRLANQEKMVKNVVDNVKSDELDKINSSVVKTCVVDNSIYEIVSTTNFADNMGCHLVKNSSGYCILGFVGDKLFKIKYYERLKTEVIQARKTEKIDNNTYRYIVRIGIHKFIMNVSKDNMEFIMDLC